MRSVFGLPDPLGAHEPGPHPAGLHEGGSSVARWSRTSEPASPRPMPQVAIGRDVLLIEGTGHAGVGAVIGLSNADVAALLQAPVLIVSEAGVGRPIDEIVLDHCLFAPSRRRLSSERW